MDESNFSFYLKKTILFEVSFRVLHYEKKSVFFLFSFLVRFSYFSDRMNFSFCFFSNFELRNMKFNSYITFETVRTDFFFLFCVGWDSSSNFDAKFWISSSVNLFSYFGVSKIKRKKVLFFFFNENVLSNCDFLFGLCFFFFGSWFLYNNFVLKINKIKTKSCLLKWREKSGKPCESCEIWNGLLIVHFFFYMLWTNSETKILVDFIMSKREFKRTAKTTTTVRIALKNFDSKFGIDIENGLDLYRMGRTKREISFYLSVTNVSA